MDIRHQYNEALNKLEEHVNDGLRDLINIYCVAIDSFENDIVDSIALYVIDMGNKDTCRYLEEILSVKEDPYLVKEFNEWIKEIKKKIKIKIGQGTKSSRLFILSFSPLNKHVLNPLNYLFSLIKLLAQFLYLAVILQG
jgi:hypothetical protein